MISFIIGYMTACATFVALFLIALPKRRSRSERTIGYKLPNLMTDAEIAECNRLYKKYQEYAQNNKNVAERTN